MPAKPLRVALGSLLIQKKLGFSDRDLVAEITENPYLQYFIGLPAYQNKAPFAPSLLVEFRKRMTEEILGEINEMIDQICYEYGLEKPRVYRKNARRDYLSLAKCKKRTKKRIRKAIKQQLQYVRRDLKYVKGYLSEGKELSEKQQERLHVIEKVYEQQKYMYDNHAHTVKDRIVSISQPYPERVLVDKIYRNRENLAYCKERGIRLSGPVLGRPIEVERAFSLAKRNYGLGLLKTKLDTTTRSSIALSIIAMNVEQINRTFLQLFSEQIIWRIKQCILALTDKNNKLLAGPAAC